MNERALHAVAGNNVRAVVAPFERRCVAGEAEMALGFFRAVTAEAGRFEDGLDVAGEIYLCLGGWRKF